MVECNLYNANVNLNYNVFIPIFYFFKTHIKNINYKQIDIPMFFSFYYGKIYFS